MDWKTVGIIANGTKPCAAELLASAAETLREAGLEVLFDRVSAKLLGVESEFSVKSLFKRCGLLVVLGGDGTLLQVVHEGTLPAPPIFGINTGTLGFLTGVGSPDFREVLVDVAAGRASISERTLLSVEVLRRGKSFWKGRALNEMVVSRGERATVVRLEVEIDGVELTEYNADGLIVATPTGSTAYSLSAGGPILAPDSGVFVVTPICAHVLTNRSVIISERSVITLQPTIGSSDVHLTLDGRTPVSLQPGDVIRCRRSRQMLRLVFPVGLPFFEVLRQKLRWSGKVV
jgi:NAD+ kinase